MEEKEDKLIKIIFIIIGVIAVLLIAVFLYVFTDRNYTISFIDEDKEISKQIYQANEEITLPSFNTLKPGYEIIGWRTEDGKEYKTNEVIKVDSSRKYYAIWKEIDCDHLNQVRINVKEATCIEDGYTGDIKCTDCNRILEQGQEIKETGKHKYLASGRCQYCFQSADQRITAQNYGDKINYTSQSYYDWKIFYNDGINVYIIASNYIEMPQDWKNDSGRYNFNPFNTNWFSNNLTIFEGGYSFVGDKIKICIDNFNDTENWKQFYNEEYADSVQGTPSLDMFIKSWNDKGYQKLYTKENEVRGIYISTTEGGEEISTMIDNHDKLYFPNTSILENCTGYYLGRENGYSANSLFKVEYNGEIGRERIDYFGKEFLRLGLRPVVRLKNDIGFEYINGEWNLVK